MLCLMMVIGMLGWILHGPSHGEEPGIGPVSLHGKLGPDSEVDRGYDVYVPGIDIHDY